MKKFTFIVLVTLLLTVPPVWADQADRCVVPDIVIEDVETGEEWIVPIDLNDYVLPEGPSEEEMKVSFGASSNPIQVTNKRIVYIDIRSSNGGPCSGALVGAKIVLTAGHCLFDGGKKRATPSNITVYAGGKDASIRAKAVKAYSNVLWEKGVEIVNREADYGIIILDKPIGNEVGTYGVRNTVAVVGEMVTVVGFPGGKS